MESLSHLIATIDAAYLSPSPLTPLNSNEIFITMLYDNEGKPNMSWTGFQALHEWLPEYSQVRKVSASCSKITGNLHMILQTSDHKLLHTIRFADSNHPSSPVEVSSCILQIPFAADSTPRTSGSLSCSLDQDDNLHLFVIDDREELLYTYGASSSISDECRKISFQQFWESVALPVGYKIKVDSGLCCTTGPNGNLHLYLTDVDGGLWYNIRNHRGAWNFWNYVPPLLLNTPDRKSAVSINHVSCSANQNGDIQICAIDSSNTLLYNVYDHSTGKFKGWTNLVLEMQNKNPHCTSNPDRFVKVSCSTDPDNTLHICGILSASVGNQKMGLMVYTWRTFNTVAYPKNCLIPVKEYAFEEEISAIPISISISHN